MFARLLHSSRVRSGDRNYQKSNSILEVDFDVSEEARGIAAALLESSEESSRQELGDLLLDELADLAQIDIVRLKISEARQYHRRSGGRVVFKQYGYYKPGSKYIYITNRTAVQGKPLAPKTFLDTLLHEWMHHYDHIKLGLNSVHTRGFYERIRSMKEKLAVI